MSQPVDDRPTSAEHGHGSTGSASGSNTLSIVAIVLGVVAVFLLPILFGVGAIVCAVVAKTRHERLSSIALAVAIVGTIAGFALGALFFAANS
jgi:membrane associated rhomboid family serine protease